VIVLKFGGTSVGDGSRIATVAELVSKQKRRKPILVVSALAGVTEELIRLAERARQGESDAIAPVVASLGERHRRAARESGVGGIDLERLLAEIERELGRAGELARGVALLRELTARTRDEILAIGELLSSRIAAAALSARGEPVVWIDPRDLIATDDAFGAANPDEDAIAAAAPRRIGAPVADGRIVVTGGFVGRSEGGETTTLGRGGSDTTAALLGAALGAGAIEIWTDVDGILTADPRLVEGARRIPEISYAEAAELAFFGAKVIHPASIRPAVRRGIPVTIRNTFRPESAGTIIHAGAAGDGVRALASRKGTTAIFVTNPRMLLAHGYAARVFAVFERARVPVDVIATSEVSIAVTVDSGASLERILRDLESFADVDVRRGLGVLTVVGQRLRSTPGVGARIFRALGDINVLLVSQGASETNVTFVVEEEALGAAMNRLHDEFFGAARVVSSAASAATAASGAAVSAEVAP